MEKKSTDLQHVVFETEEAGRVEAMWSSLRLNAAKMFRTGGTATPSGAGTTDGSRAASNRSCG